MINIATAISRNATKWLNEHSSWEELSVRLSQPVVTNETIAQYLKASKEQQADIKDVGGFVGGKVNGRRAKGFVSERRLLTLDLDFADQNTLARVEEQLGMFAYVVYSTHKHTADSPRYRLVVLLDRNTIAEEYEAVIRRVAEMVGMESVDHTSFQYERLMFFPSHAKDAEFVYVKSDSKKPLEVQTILNTYDDWRNVAEWAIAPAEEAIVKRTIDRQGDPYLKSGFVGAFCRAYNIHEAIETFLPEVYSKSGDRYTYVEGTTGSGVVIYEDKFAYSHHSSDPAGNKLTNAFDLVRIHKFGSMDEGSKATTSSKLPSFLGFVEYLAKDNEVKKQLILNASQDFKQESTDWMVSLETNIDGSLKETIRNYNLIFVNDDNLKDLLGFNDFSKREFLRRKPFWRSITEHTSELTDRDEVYMRDYLERQYNLTSTYKFRDAIVIECHENMIHPIKDYLDNLKWDGTNRLETLFHEYLGIENTEYSRAASRKFLVGAVARIYEPGIKFEYMPVFVGKQGEGKSSVAKALGRTWFSDAPGQIGSKDAYEQMQGVWIIEFAELSALRKSDVEGVKHFVSQRTDRFRVAYGRRTETFPRQCVFIGTTNKYEFLTDTENRRFLPLETRVVAPKKDFRTGLKDFEINQVWAEAKYMYEQGESLYLTEHEELVAAKVQNDHKEQDSIRGIVENYLETPVPKQWNEYSIEARQMFFQTATMHTDEMLGQAEMELRTSICLKEILVECFEQQLGKEDYVLVGKIKNAMAEMPEWSSKPDCRKRLGIYGQQRCYSRIGKGDRELLEQSSEEEMWS